MLKSKLYLILSGAVILVSVVGVVLAESGGDVTITFWVAGCGGAALLAVNFFAVFLGTKAVRIAPFFVGLGILLCFAVVAVFGLFSTLWQLESLVLLCVALLSSAALCCVFWGRGSFRKWALCVGIVLLIALAVSFALANSPKLF